MPEDLPSAELFVTKGILPENLPPIFTTKRLWEHFAEFGQAYGIISKSVGDNSIYNSSKRGGQRRIFSIPHPAFIRDAGLFYEKHWEHISKTLDSPINSASIPIFASSGNRHVRITPHSDLPKIRLRAFSRFKFCLVTDVARFFPSVYTHSLPWALHGKAASKEDSNPQSAKIYGNKLDFILRNSQSRQTVGIAVGPDSSKVAAEILMCSVDRAFFKLSGKNKPVAVRHVDDYWIAGNTHEECERHLSNLRTALRDHELDINELKTKIISTKLVFADDWPFDFDEELDRALSPLTGKPGRALSILSNIVERATVTNDDGIIRHIIKKIDESQLWARDWELLEHFLAQCAIQFPHSFDYVARVIAWRNRRWAGEIDASLWRDITLLTINQSAALGRDSEVTWALWLAKELNIKLAKSSTDPIIQNSNPLVLALLAHMQKHKLLTDRSISKKLLNKISGHPLSGPFWPLTLELMHLGIGDADWLKAGGGAALSKLHGVKASIIDWGARPKVFGSDGTDDDTPDSAIEDYSADYGSSGADDDDDEDDEDDDGFEDDYDERNDGRPDDKFDPMEWLNNLDN